MPRFSSFAIFALVGVRLTSEVLAFQLVRGDKVKAVTLRESPKSCIIVRVSLLSCVNGDAPHLVLVCGVLDGSRAGNNN